MTSGNQVMLLDANVLIAAHRDYYAPDLCLGFWDCAAHHLAAGRLLVIDRVRDEISSPPDLVTWMGQVPKNAHISTSAAPVAQAYTSVMNWVQNNPQFTPAAKNAFAGKADGWLVAYAMVNAAQVVTNEVFDPNIRRDVKIPNVCRHFQVDYRNSYGMLRRLGAQFAWEPPRP